MIPPITLEHIGLKAEEPYLVSRERERCKFVADMDRV